jgi:hypothetical protein
MTAIAGTTLIYPFSPLSSAGVQSIFPSGFKAVPGTHLAATSLSVYL